MSLFYSDISSEQHISYSDLITDLSNISKHSPYCFEQGYYQTFLRIIFSMLSGKKITLLDPDLSSESLKDLTGHSDFASFEEPTSSVRIPKTKHELIQSLRNTSDSWELTLFTSGTTNKPKAITHSFKSITRNTRLYPHTDSPKIWGFSYLPTHMAGVQVFLQALLNGDSMVRLIGLSKKDQIESIQKFNVTHISATPTFYRLLLPTDEPFPTVQKITSGGEKFEASLEAEISKTFPNATFTNVYASTEGGALFGAKGEVFHVSESIKDFVRFKDEELILHSSLLGKSMQNNIEWYSTGDLVEIISESPLQFKFKARISDQVNIGGFKVNVLEIEEVLKQHPAIKQSRVFAKPNSVLGNLLCAEIIASHSISEKEIRTFLASKVQEAKIPRMFKFVDEISTTSTGKIDRKVA
ncbi:MAG: long-chain fatty acid--CoA ligase [Balneolaceae bacterium]|nr:long-chain fatty acid--CoA ligase [Balneolaceae bacterium]